MAPRLSILLSIFLISSRSRLTTMALSTNANIVASQSSGGGTADHHRPRHLPPGVRRHHQHPLQRTRHNPRGGGRGGGVDHDAESANARLRMEEATLVEGLLRDAVVVASLVDRHIDDEGGRMLLFPSVRQCNSGKRMNPLECPSLIFVLSSFILILLHPHTPHTHPTHARRWFSWQRSRRLATRESFDVL
jgi:hypothetical protein